MLIRLAQNSGEIILENGSYTGNNSAIILENSSNVFFEKPILKAAGNHPVVNNSIIVFPPHSLKEYLKGEIIVERQKHDVFEYLKSTGGENTYGSIKALEMDKLRLSEAPSEGNGCPTMFFRGKIDFLLFCSEGEKIQMKLKYKTVGRNTLECPPLILFAPDGNGQTLEGIPANSSRKLTFEAKMNGVYRLRVEPGRNTIQVRNSSAPVNVSVIDGIIHLISPKGKLYFSIPPRTDNLPY